MCARTHARSLAHVFVVCACVCLHACLCPSIHAFICLHNNTGDFKSISWNILYLLQAAVLHDTVEDTDTTLDEVEENFGAHVRSVVAEVTDDKSLPKQERKRLQVVNAPHKSREAKLVKLADKLYNLRDLSISTPSGWSEGRVQEYFVWASQVVKGLSGTCKVLEDKLADVLAKKGIRLETIVSEAE